MYNELLMDKILKIIMKDPEAYEYYDYDCFSIIVNDHGSVFWFETRGGISDYVHDYLVTEIEKTLGLMYLYNIKEC